jgi:hypothetical protein
VEEGLAEVRALSTEAEEAAALRPEPRVWIERPDHARSILHWRYQVR